MYIAALGNILKKVMFSLSNLGNTFPTGIAEVQEQGKLCEP